MKILCTGDIHIGRRSSRLPPHLDDHGNSCSAAWSRIVDRAIREQVDLVAISGDVVDEANRYLEAIGPLEAGLRRLAAAEITTILVSGNHDHDVLPALADSLDSRAVRLLGRGGRWERFTFEKGEERLHIDGWSFPQAHYALSPLENYEPSLDATPVMAVVHADLEIPGSRYAPVSLPELRRHPRVFFLLGHVHTPQFVDEAGGARFLYPGSPQAINRGESGVHGVHLVEVRGDVLTVQQIPLSSVRYETLEVTVDGLERVEEVDARVSTALRANLDELAAESDLLRCVRYRLRLVGRTGLQRGIEARLSELAGDLELTIGSTSGSIESVEVDTLPVYELPRLATGAGPPAVLANLLQDDQPEEQLLTELRRMVSEVHGSRSFAEVSAGDEGLVEMEVAALAELRRAATLLLDELISQKEDSA